MAGKGGGRQPTIFEARRGRPHSPLGGARPRPADPGQDRDGNAGLCLMACREHQLRPTLDVSHRRTVVACIVRVGPNRSQGARRHRRNRRRRTMPSSRCGPLSVCGLLRAVHCTGTWCQRPDYQLHRQCSRTRCCPEPLLVVHREYQLSVGSQPGPRSLLLQLPF